jgi:hypothetical protein
MKIFISYASERRSVAEKVAFALRGRGHLALFDKDDLPAAKSYDEQIAKVISQSDLMIFLISPESVASGRYTLTELVLARQRWPSAQGRVLPVLISPTPLAEIPNYLSSVQILTPEGNIPAEVALAVDQIAPAARPGRILPIALMLGAASGAISGFGPLKSDSWNEAWASIKDLVGNWIGFLPEPLSYPAPFAFSVVVSVIIVLWDRITPIRSLVVFPIVVVSWVCAYYAAFSLVLQLDQMRIMSAYSSPNPSQCSETLEGLAGTSNKPQPDGERTTAVGQEAICKEINRYRGEIEPIFSRLTTLVYLFAGLTGGFVGSVLMMLGLGRLSVRLRQLDAMTLVVLTGTAAGALLGMGEKKTFLLFFVWHTVIALAIAWQLTKPVPRELGQ